MQICKRPGDLESSEVEKPAQLKEEHELNDTYSIDEGKFATFNISYLRFTVQHGLPIHYNLWTIAEITLPVLFFQWFSLNFRISSFSTKTCFWKSWKWRDGNTYSW